MKRVSLILATYNSKDNFIKTYKSIKKQTYEEIEIVVIDGGSKDGTCEVIKEISEKETKNFLWISEKDSGIYNAMNKGLRLATGDILAFFNDEFTDNRAIEKIVDAIENSGMDGAHSDLVYCKDGRIIRKWEMGEGDIRQGWMPAHPTLFLKKEVYQKYGGYKENYKCAADYEFMVRILKNQDVKLKYIPETFVSMFYGGTSSGGIRSYWVSFKEGIRALKENEVKDAYRITLKRMCKVVMQFF